MTSPYTPEVEKSKFGQNRISSNPDGTYTYRGQVYYDIGPARKARQAFGKGEEYQAPPSPSEMREIGKQMGDAYGLSKQFEERMSPFSKEKINIENSKEIAKYMDNGMYEQSFPGTESIVRKAMESGRVTHTDLWVHLIMKSDSQNPLSLVDSWINRNPWENSMDWVPIIGSLQGIGQLYKLSETIERLDNGDDDYFDTEQGKKDLQTLLIYSDFHSRDRNFGYNVSQILRNLPAFAGEMFATRGQFGWVKKGVTEGIERQLAKVASGKIKNKLLQKAGEFGLRAAGSTAGAVSQASTIGTPRMVRKYQELTMPQFEGVGRDEYGKINDFIFAEGEDAWTAAAKAYGDVAIEYISEHSGGGFNMLGGELKSYIIKKGLLTAFKKANPSKTYGEIMGMFEKVGYHGIFNEWMEERLGNVLRTPIEGFHWPTWEGHLTELTAFAFPGITANVVGVAADLGDKTKKSEEEQLFEFVKEFAERAMTSPRPVETALGLTEKQGLDPIERRGPKITDDYKKKVLERTEDIGTSELINFFYDENNQDLVDLSLGWYRDGFENAINEVQSNEVPELSDLNNRNMFRAMVAAFSVSKGPKANADHSIDYLMQFLEKGENPVMNAVYTNSKGEQKEGPFIISKSTGRAKGLADAEIENIDKYMALVKYFEGDTDKVDSWLSEVHSGSELWDMLSNLGYVDAKNKPKTSLARSTPEVHGAEIFGPKVGTFWLNLKGVSSIPTIDRWMTRQVRRWIGMPLASSGGQKYTWSQAKKEYEKIKKLPPSEREKAITGKKGQRSLGQSFLKDPTTREEFLLYRNVIQNITDAFNRETGETLDADQVQALLWYMEKDLYLRAGTRASDLDLTDYQRAVNARYQELQPTSSTSTSIGEVETEATQNIPTPGQAEEDSEQPIQEPGENIEQESDSPGPALTEDGQSSEEIREEEPDLDRRLSERVSKRDEYVNQLSGDNAGETFATALAKAKLNLTHGASVTNYGAKNYQEESIDENGNRIKHNIYLSEDGGTGYSIAEVTTKSGKKHIELQSIFNNNPTLDIDSFIYNAIYQARTFNLPLRVEVFDTPVMQMYEDYGFEEISREKWNDDLRPEDWTKEYDDMMGQKSNPDYVTMEWKPAREGLDELSTKEGKLGYLARKFIDRFKPLLNLTDQIRGNRILYDNEDIHTTAMLTNNRIAARQDEIFQRVIKTLQTITDAGFTIDELGDYLHAQHSKEGNKLVRDRGGMKDGGRGMYIRDANKILAKYKNTRLPVFAREFREYVRLEKEIRLQAGLIDQATYDAWDSMFDYYVPLRAANDDPGGLFGQSPGRGFETKGPESKRIKAVSEMVKRRNPVIQTLMNLDDAIIRSENNQVGLSMLNLVREFGVEGVEVRKLQYRPQFDKDGEISYMQPELLGRDDYVVKEDGNMYVLNIQEESLLRALTGFSHGAVPILNNINGFLRNMITVYNPEFWISNFARDIQTAGINLAGEHSNEMANKVMSWTLGGGPASGIWHSTYKKEGYNEWAEWYEDMTQQGGKVSWKTFEDFDAKQQRVLKSILDGENGKVRMAGAEIGKFINTVGDAVEQGVRLSAYRAAVESGVPKRQAALLARNLTVDFNKKGELGALMNSMYLFANASVQGSARVIGSIIDENSATRYYGIGLTGLSYTMAMMSMGQDPDEWALKSDWEKFNNYIIQTPNGWDMRLRVPYGYNIFHAIGVALAEVHHEKQLSGEVNGGNVQRQVSNVLGAVNDAFNPVGGDSWTTMVPTAFQPAIQMMANEKWHGGSIRPEIFNSLQKGDLKTKRGTPKMFLDLSESLHRVTGGKIQYEDGKEYRYSGNWQPELLRTSLHPNNLQHITEFVGGGVGKLFTRSISSAEHFFNKKKLPPTKNLPFVRLFVQGSNVDQFKTATYKLVNWSKNYSLKPHEINRFHSFLSRSVDNDLITEEKGIELLKIFNENQRKRSAKPKKEKMTRSKSRSRRRSRQSKPGLEDLINESKKTMNVNP